MCKTKSRTMTASIRYGAVQHSAVQYRTVRRFSSSVTTSFNKWQRCGVDGRLDRTRVCTLCNDWSCSDAYRCTCLGWVLHRSVITMENKALDGVRYSTVVREALRLFGMLVKVINCNRRGARCEMGIGSNDYIFFVDKKNPIPATAIMIHRHASPSNTFFLSTFIHLISKTAPHRSLTVACHFGFGYVECLQFIVLRKEGSARRVWFALLLRNIVGCSIRRATERLP